MKKVAVAIGALTVAALLATPSHAQGAAAGAASDPDQARIADLITASHILANEGVLDGFGHVTTRSTTNPNRMYIPRAMPPALVSRADIVEVEIDADCRPVDSKAPRLNGERFIHCQIYKARSEVQSVIHSHDLAVIPFGIAGVPLRPVVAQAGFLPPETPLFEVRDANKNEEQRGMLVSNARLGDALARQLGGSPVILMRGHGETVVARSVREATIRALYTNINAKAQLAGMSLNPDITAMNEFELALNSQENFDADRPWQHYLSRLRR